MESGNFPSKLPSLSYVSGGANGNNHPNNASGQGPLVREHDQYMPIANIIRIMRRVLPPHAKISDDAKETIQECVSEYISFVTSEANERCQREHRKTVTAEDLLWAMGKLGFDDYIAPLSAYINRYREIETGRSPLRSELFVRQLMVDNYEPPLGLPLYGPVFNYGPVTGPEPVMLDVMGMGQAMGGPMNGDFGGQMGGPVGGYYGEASGVGGSSSNPGLLDLEPYTQ